MNIFFLDHDPGFAAQFHADKHVIKMILESAQLLSTAHRVLDGKQSFKYDKIGRKLKTYLLEDEREEILYKSTHVNHPMAIWVRESKENYMWLFDLWLSLMEEYTFRFGKHHASERLIPYLKNVPSNIPNVSLTYPPNTMDKEYIISESVVDNYRNYYIKGKIDLLKYTKRNKPYWLP